MTSKARSLRERMSIDPDAPAPISEPRRRPAPPVEPVPDPAGPEQKAPEPPAPDPPALDPPAPEPMAPQERAPEQAAPDPPAPAPPTPASLADSDAPVTTPAPGTTPQDPAPAASRTASARTTSRRAPARRAGRRSARDGVDWATALDDPGIAPGVNGYRSFYVSDEVFARFRAAVYWTARRPEAQDVPDNMSAGIEDYMDSVATDLERRFNDRGVFPPTPDQIRAHRRRQSSS